MTNNPSSDSVTAVHSTEAELGQVQLHLETGPGQGPAADGNNQRKKSSSAIAGDTEEIIVKKTSKSCTDVTANAAGVVMACANIVTGAEVFMAESNIRKNSKASSCTAEETAAVTTALLCKENLGIKLYFFI